MKTLSKGEMVRQHRVEMRRHDVALLRIHGHASAIKSRRRKRR